MFQVSGSYISSLSPHLISSCYDLHFLESMGQLGISKSASVHQSCLIDLQWRNVQKECAGKEQPLSVPPIGRTH